MTTTSHNGHDALVLVDERQGVTIIPQLTELRRLNWFDGKLLRADDLRLEQDYMRGLVRRANRAGGPGVVHGFTCRLAQGGDIRVGPGLAIDPGGRSLLLPVDVSLDVEDLIERTAGGLHEHVKRIHPKKKKPSLGKLLAQHDFEDCVEPEVVGKAPVGGARWYVITVGWAEGLCGSEEVHGRLCEDACTTSTDRPWRVEGLVFRAHPVHPESALAASSAVALDERHERSLLASALFADELAAAGSLISGDGLRGPVWCSGAAPPDAARDEVPLGVMSRQGGTTRFVDIWIARRERMEPPPRRYWAGRMAMRPWDVFLAQVLQFQCQLSEVLEDGPQGGTPFDPCAERQSALEEALEQLEQRVTAEAGEEGVDDPMFEKLRQRVIALRIGGFAAAGAQRILVDGGIVELPPAGYLPVDPKGPPALEQQVRALLGGGVELTFCTTRHDAVARAFEEAQHLDRISLLRGLDDPARREEVEIVVPDAEVEETSVRDTWSGTFAMGGEQEGDDGEPAESQRPELFGAGRLDWTAELALRWAGRAELEDGGEDDAAQSRAVAAWIEATADRDPLAAAEGDAIGVAGSFDSTLGDNPEAYRRASFRGALRVTGTESRPDGVRVRGVLDGLAVARAQGDEGGDQTVPWTANQVPVELLARATDDGGRQAIARLRVSETTTYSARIAWHGEADDVSVEAFESNRRLGMLKAVLGQRIASLRLDREPGAAAGSHPARKGAEAAVREIERAVDEPGYAEEALRRLFPENDDGFRLRPTRDWVLFRRRAQMRCGPLAPPAVARETFAVYAFAHRQPGIATHDIAQPREPTYIGEVAFAAGSDALQGAAAVVSAWARAAQKGGEIPAAGVLSGAPGGDALGERRLERLVDELAAITPRADDYRAHVIQPGQLQLDKRGADGAFVVALAPREEVETPTVLVDVIAVGVDWTKRYKAALSNEQYEAALKVTFTAHHVLGQLSFPQDSGDPNDDPAPEKLGEVYREQLGETGVELVDVWTVEGHPDAGDESVQLARGIAVRDAVGPASDAPGIRRFPVAEEQLAQARDQGLEGATLIIVVPEVD